MSTLNEHQAESEQALIYAAELRELYGRQKQKVLELEASKAQLEEAMLKLVEAERLRDEFVANCSHELRTPLTPIIGYAKVLTNYNMTPDQVSEYAASIVTQAERLARVINSLLRVASLRSDASIEGEGVPLSEVLQEAQGILASAGRKVSQEIRHGCDGCLVDRFRVTEVLGYLVDNVLKFTPPDSPVEIVADSGTGEHLEIAVVDHGPGIDGSHLHAAFQPFRQGDGSSTRTQGGLGLGLYFCKELVGALGGDIWIEQSPGGGATVRFTVPVGDQKGRLGLATQDPSTEGSPPPTAH